jgi:sulfur transfer complex TusBCD TusB component (DsrH family)
MKILHIIKELNSNLPMEIIKGHGEDAEVHILLLHDAVLLSPESFPSQARLHIGAVDAAARNITSGVEELTYDEIVDLICECDRVICW